MDIDGTLANLDGYVPPSAITACREARRQGHLLYVCSGRPRIHISSKILAIGFDGAASAGGAHIETGDTSGGAPYQGKVIFDAVMPVELIKQISGYLDKWQCGFSLERNDETLANWYHISHWERILKQITDLGKTDDDLAGHINNLKKNPLPDNPEDPGNVCFYEGISKIMFVVSDKISFADIEQRFGRVCEIFYTPYFGDECGEIGSLGVHKGLALKKIAEYHGIPLSETIVFGDSDNDRLMIECAGIGVAMGNATDALKAIADDTTSSLDDNGLFNGFKKLGLM